MNNSNKLIEKIKAQDLRPAPRWQFQLRDSALWILFISSTLFGALAFSIILYAVQQADFSLTRHISHSWYEMLLSLIPLVWIIFLIICLVLIILSIRNSRKGYKFNALSILGLGSALSILIGTLFFVTGGGNWLDQTFARKINQYESVEDRKTAVWSNPEEGTLSGKILTVSDKSFEIEDFTGKLWKVDYSDADLAPSIEIMEGEIIKMTGKMESEKTFKANIIRPWGGSQHKHRGGWKNN